MKSKGGTASKPIPPFYNPACLYFYDKRCGFYTAFHTADIRKELPDATGFSPTSFHYMRWFYDRYSPLFENLRQLAVEFDSDPANLTKASSNEPNLRQLAVELFSIPWGHHQTIIGKCPSLEESIFYVHELGAEYSRLGVLKADKEQHVHTCPPT